MAIIKLQSSDGEFFETDVEVAKCSATIKTMLEDCCLDDDGEEAIIPLPSVSSSILKCFLQWANHHKDDPIPTDDDKTKEKCTDEISSWDADFLMVDQSTLFEIIVAANYLDTKRLMAAACKTVANMIKGKSPKEIREHFDIGDDLTPEEREKVRQEDEWCKEK
ncbi:S-phase kinase-associated protein 1-like [Sitodiplosis mosellana]|uniref:S-phase kinase-associated protein 1-like n=1 Tax=Sitodiplosis mosellana TaxID=263140 RepID=UPI002443E770|nr:S-phase kinase-associated protein 1-like [Sitodiplosis mosellana]